MDKRTITSPENGLKGGRPLSLKTIATQRLLERLSVVVEENFEAIFQPQLEKAMKGDFNAYRDLLDRIGVKDIEKKSGMEITEPIQVFITSYQKYQEEEC